jgi:hypothetical protein
MLLHINFPACSTKQPLIFRHCTHSICRILSSHVETSDRMVFKTLCCINKTHFPFLLVDESLEKLPSEQFLSSFLIVLTTTKVRYSAINFFSS